MNHKLEQIKAFRFFVLKHIKDLTLEQLNCIPKGYNNNIIWNLGHLVSAAQTLCYKRAGLAPTVDDKYISPFLPTTKPEYFISREEIEIMKGLLISTVDTLKEDLVGKDFSKYSKSERIKEFYGIDVSSIEEVIEFLLYHEGFHSGYIVALKRLV